MSWWKKFTNFFSKDKSVPKTEVDEVVYVKSKEEILEEETEKATLTLRRFDDAPDRREVKTSPKLKVPTKRARDKGRFVADDKSTPHINEAWVGGKAPAKKKVTAKKKATKKPKRKSTKNEKPKYRRTKRKR